MNFQYFILSVNIRIFQLIEYFIDIIIQYLFQTEDFIRKNNNNESFKRNKYSNTKYLITFYIKWILL